MDKIAFLEANINIVERTEGLLAEQIKTGEVLPGYPLYTGEKRVDSGVSFQGYQNLG